MELVVVFCRPSFYLFTELCKRKKKRDKTTLMKGLYIWIELVLLHYASASLILKFKIQNQFSQMSPQKTYNCQHLPDFLYWSFQQGGKKKCVRGAKRYTADYNFVDYKLNREITKQEWFIEGGLRKWWETEPAILLAKRVSQMFCYIKYMWTCMWRAEMSAVSSLSSR